MNDKVKPKVIVLLGQTSTGKSDIAVMLAKKFNGEVISADSRQVYKGLDIGSGKITKKEMKGVPHHLLDVTIPKKTFTVTDFKNLADRKIKEILAKGKTPILAGGTGFYIDAVVSGTVFPEVPPNENLRKTLDRKTPEQLFAMLQKLDRIRSKTIDRYNKVRLVRAIEIAKHLGKVPRVKVRPSQYEFIKIGLHLPEQELKAKIEKRLLVRIKKGMLEEAENLHKKGLSWKRMEELGLEYRYMALYLQNKITKKEMLQELKTKIYQYAKRQKTWFQRDKNTQWCEPRNYEEIEKYISEKLKAE